MLEVAGLTAGYGGSMVLRGVDLRVGENSVVAVLGSNGVGKTTLMKCVMGLVEPSEGDVLFMGRSIGRLPSYRRSSLGIGYVPQGREIFPFLSVEENIALGLEAFPAARRRGEELAYELFPILSEIRGRRGGVLSGGQQQILALARALVQRPRLLILDEPTEGIQPSIVQEIEDAIGRASREGVSVLLVEQFADFALAHADYYYLMQRGGIEREGPVSGENREEILNGIGI
jgi:urea transport system ATP-binding protein